APYVGQFYLSDGCTPTRSILIHDLIKQTFEPDIVSTRYTLSHRAIRALSAAIATTCIGLDSASMLLPIADLASASAPASSTSQAPLRNLLPFAEHHV